MTSALITTHNKYAKEYLLRQYILCVRISVHELHMHIHIHNNIHILYIHKVSRIITKLGLSDLVTFAYICIYIYIDVYSVQQECAAPNFSLCMRLKNITFVVRETSDSRHNRRPIKRSPEVPQYDIITVMVWRIFRESSIRTPNWTTVSRQSLGQLYVWWLLFF